MIGDIHGYYDSFLGLVSKLNLDDGDLVISIGDMIDGGPESVGVVDFFIENDQFLAILGNHEQMLLDYWNKKSKFDLIQPEIRWILGLKEPFGQKQEINDSRISLKTTHRNSSGKVQDSPCRISGFPIFFEFG